MIEDAVLGTGIDLVETDRMEETLQRWNGDFKRRCFLEREQRYCDGQACPARHYAGRFAVKEAVTKAFGTGIGPHIGWLDIEVERDPVSGAPSVRLHGQAARLARERGVARLLVSLSHTRTYAVAHALIVGGGDPPA